MRFWARVGLAAGVLGSVIAIAGPVVVDAGLAEYAPRQGISGTVKSVGSDSMVTMMTRWTEDFRREYPGVKVEVEGKGSSTAPPALVESLAQFGPMSRDMKSSEAEAFEKKFGYKPTGLRVAIDALGVFVHKDNPLREISLDQLAKAFSVAGPDLTWGDLGVMEPRLKDKPLALYGRNSASGTYGYFKEHALGKADFKATVKEQPGSSGVVQAVATDVTGLGYSGVGYTTADVRMLKITGADGAGVEGTYENCLSGEYPLARFLLVYINKDPGASLDPLRGEFVRFIFSRQGQEAVVKDGYFPVTAEMAAEELRKAGL